LIPLKPYAIRLLGETLQVGGETPSETPTLALIQVGHLLYFGSNFLNLQVIIVSSRTNIGGIFP